MVTQPEKLHLLDILIVEDDPDDQLLLRWAFEDARVVNRVIYISSMAELREYLEVNGESSDQQRPPPGLIFIDPLMSGMDGVQALQTIRDYHVLSQVPIVFLILSNAEKEFVASRRLEADGYIQLPVTPENIYHAILPIAGLRFGVFSD